MSLAASARPGVVTDNEGSADEEIGSEEARALAIRVLREDAALILRLSQ